MTHIIRVRACVAVLEGGRILLVPHFYGGTDPDQWHVPGGGVKFGEQLRTAAVREFREETGLWVECHGLVGIYEEIQGHIPWHGVTVAYYGVVIGGSLRAEDTKFSAYGDKTPQWFSAQELALLNYYPPDVIEEITEHNGDAFEP
jgi:ADP-ribose pyrophosphatase YjhB (NUDIX family)